MEKEEISKIIGYFEARVYKLEQEVAKLQKEQRLIKRHGKFEI